MIRHDKEIDRGLIGRNGETVPLVGCRLSGHLSGRVGEWLLTQRFRNVEKTPIEATYLFPLPEDAAVCGFSIRAGERLLSGVVEEREKAFDTYDQAMANGNGAFLLDQERPNVFQISVGNLQPGQEVQVELRFIQLAAPEPRGVRVMIPTTISPRYTPAHLSAEAKTEIERITPPYADAVPYGLSLELEVVMALPVKTVESPSHPLRVEVDGCTARIGFGQQTTALDRDLVILIETAQVHAMSALSAERNGREHLLIECIPEAQPASGQERKTVVFLVDCSGSMDGDSIAQARQAVELCLRALQPGDRFQVVRFGSDCRPLSPHPVGFSQESLDAAVAQIRAMGADLGGTEILGALRQIESMTGTEQINLLVLTDGQVGNEDEVLTWAGGMKHRCRVFSFGIGAGSSEYLVRGLARRGGGAAEFIYPGERIEPKVLRQFARVAAPVATNLVIDWGTGGAESATQHIPAVFAGESLLVAARFPAGRKPSEGARVTVRGTTKAGELVWTAEVRRSHPGEGGAAALWWARQAILELEETHGERQAGSRQKRGGQDAWQKKMIALSCEYGILCGSTSFVAIEERATDQKSQGSAELRRIPVQITTGWHGGARRPMGVGAGVPGIFSCMSAPIRQVYSSSICPSGADASASMPARRRKRGSVDDNDVVFSSAVMEHSIGTHAAGGEDTANILSIKILMLQQAEGWFLLEEPIAGFAGRSLSELKRWARELTVAAGDDPEKILATALAIHLLRTNAASEEDLWRAGVSKAAALLSGHAVKCSAGAELFAWLSEKLE